MTAHNGFDAARECASVIDFIPDEIDFCARYYGGSPRKDLTRAEALKLTAGDLAIVTVYEGAGTKGSYFSRDQGGKDATIALAQAERVGQPHGSAIYFAVDFDASAVQIADRIIPYFEAVVPVLTGKYQIGVYGSGLVCRTLMARGLVRYLWLACAAWQGTASLFKAGGWNIHQHTPNADSLGLGFQIDLNISADEDYGQFFVEAE